MRPLAALVIAVSSSSALAIDVSPEAAPVLDRMFAWYNQIDGAEATVIQTMPMPAPAESVTQTMSVAAMKPNQFAVRYEQQTGEGGIPDMIEMNMVSNGKTMWQYLKKEKVWSDTGEAPATFDSDAYPRLNMLGPAAAALDLLGTKSRESFLDGFGKVTHVGEQNGSTRLQLFPTDLPPGIDPPKILLTVGPESGPWVQQIAITMPAAMSPNGTEIALNVVFKDWKKLNKADDHSKLFTFTPPEGWEKVVNIDNHIADLMGAPEPSTTPPSPETRGGAAPPHPMVGKAAPAFELPDLKGQTVSLASLKGKTVILDFWATWCGPCKQGLPILMDVAKSRAADNVVLWSVDMGEPATKVQKFLERSKWDLNVMLDQKNEVARKYGVRGIPHTVVIDPDGIIRMVEIGFGGKEHTTKAMNNIIDEIKNGSAGG